MARRGCPCDEPNATPVIGGATRARRSAPVGDYVSPHAAVA